MATTSPSSSGSSLRLPTLQSMFAGNHGDVMLIGYYSALLKLFDGANQKSDPTECTAAEEIVDWVGFGVTVTLYCARHFVLERKNPIIAKRPLWMKIVRSLIFATLILCLHSQPIACSLPSSGDLHTLSYVQGAIMLTIAIVASEVCRSQIWSSPATTTADGHRRGISDVENPGEAQEMTPAVTDEY